MESMNLFENDSAAPKDNLIHYQGELGDFWYDPREFEVLIHEIMEFEYLHYVGNSGAVDLPKGCINTRFMFRECILPDGTTLGNDFDTSEVIDMQGMFAECEIPAGFFLGDKFDTSNVTNMRAMFYKCNLPEDFSLGHKFDTSKVTDMYRMFEECNLPGLFSW